ncbi:uncharacterized protein PODANS_6_10420 [Podospora anserina S mat+]|uniref:Podospora anserina S mat+ genomic DNA chromosome 6, supercontig 4 n=1 Tax=Podospora anserina (strain S / ATCC MYA-4624 / DSM 980 / FGSC 10383) TaxID=515849 RepID=B2ANG7_PODAN|nr:uncharacterized protein PODANS_6_10420 [Podospora anserina S mat+]CAP65549.1 unnamed protein product [Podospora anserina S mat+]CDP31544.1 Putative protein of unknown function [Podospora anserina S mat+]
MRTATILTAGAISAASAGRINRADFRREDIIYKDVAIIGGGASGAHAAVRLRQDYNKSVVVVEREPILGGHVDTYVDKTTGRTHDYGLALYFPYLDSFDFFSRPEINVTLSPWFPAGGNEVRYIDFTSGQELTSTFQPPDESAGPIAVKKFHDLMTANGWDNMTQPGYWGFPAGKDIPADLLLPIGQFAKKHGIEAMLSTMYPSTGGGVGSRGNFEDILTLSIIKAFPTAWSKVFFGEVAMFSIDGGNQFLYDKISTLLGKDVLYNSQVVNSKRSNSGIELVVDSARLDDDEEQPGKSRKGKGKGKATKKLIIAKKLLLAIPPTRENLAPFDLTPAEKAHFSKPKYGRSHTAIAKHSKLPAGVQLRNLPLSATANPLSPFLQTPFVLSFTSLATDSPLFSLGSSGTNYTAFPPSEAKKVARKAIQTMVDAGTLPDLEGEEVEFVAWSDHGPGGFGVSAQELREGWMEDMYALQGKRSTWFTGNGIAADFTTMLWKFNDQMLDRIVEGL